MQINEGPAVPTARRHISLGRLLYLAWYAPKAGIIQGTREGWVNTVLSARGKKQMQQAALRLPPLPVPEPASPAVYFLTGARFWYQTAFCAYTLANFAEGQVRFRILSDGTLSAAQETILRKVLTGCEIIGVEAITERLDAVIPSSKFPTLRARRITYPHLRKITDVHSQGDGWKLVLDSDMLFHAASSTIIEWLQHPSKPLHMIDLETSYGYSEALMRELAGHLIPPRVNVGVCGLRSEALDWERIEFWARTLIEREGSHYLQEQALTAMLVGSGDRIAIPAHEGVVCPSRAESTSPTAPLHHYVAESKAWYFRYAWRSVASARAGDVV